MRVGVLCHGYHLQAPNWQEIVWGEPPYYMGRLPTAVLLALNERAEGLGFGTGASEEAGLKEGAYIFNALIENFNRLGRFMQFQGIDLDRAKKKIARIGLPEIVSQNTTEEVFQSLFIMQSLNVEVVYQVSSPFHILRCWRDACTSYRETPELLSVKIFPVWSETGPEMSEVVILEPPHRPDRTASLYSFAKELMVLQP